MKLIFTQSYLDLRYQIVIFKLRKMKSYLIIIAICVSTVAQATIKTDCSKIILQSGRVIEAEIVEINQSEVHYRRCGQKTNVDYIILTEAILVIKNSQDEVILFPKKEVDEDFLPENQKLYEMNAILALLFSTGFSFIAFYFIYRSEQILQQYPNRYKPINKKMLKWAKRIAITSSILLFLIGLIMRNILF